MSVATWLIAGLVGKNHYQPRPTTNSIIDMKQGLTMFCSYRLFRLLHLMPAKPFPSFMVLSQTIITVGANKHFRALRRPSPSSKDRVYDEIYDR